MPKTITQGRNQTGTVTDYRDQVKTCENFIKIGDITSGLGTNVGFEDYLQYHKLIFSFIRPMSPEGHERLLSSGTVTMSDVQVLLANHHNIPLMLQKLWTGDKIDIIETQRTENTEGGTLRPIEKMTFTDCYIVGSEYYGDKYEFLFRALKFEVERTPTRQTGEQEGVVPAGFDLTTNQLIGA